LCSLSNRITLPKTILFITSWFPSKKHPSLGNFVLRHAQAAAKSNKVVVLYATALDDIDRSSLEETTSDGVEVWTYFYPTINRGGKLKSLVKAGLYMRAWRQLISQYIYSRGKPDLVHLNVMFPAGRIVRDLKTRYKIPYVVSEHWTGYLPEDGRFKKLPLMARRMIRNTAREANRILPVSEDLEAALISEGIGRRYQRLANVIDTNKFSLPLERKDEHLKLLHISNLHGEQKNIRGLFSALSKLKEQRSFELTVVGEEGAEKAKELAEEFGLAEQCVFLQKLTQDEVIAEMQKHQVLLLFSRFENMPCVLIEAAATGMKIVSTDVGGISEFFNREEKNAILVQSEDEEALVESLLQLDKFEWKTEMELHTWAEENFSLEKIGEQLDSIYEEVLHEKDKA